MFNVSCLLRAPLTLRTLPILIDRFIHCQCFFNELEHFSPRRLLFHGNLIQSLAVSLHTSKLTFKNSTWRSLCIDCFVGAAEQTATFALYTTS